MDCMSKQKESIPVENLVLLVDALHAYRETLQTIVNECQEQKVDGVVMDGWPTLVAAVLEIKKQCSKFVSRTSKMQMVDPYLLLLPGQQMPYERKPKNSKSEQQTKENDRSSRKGIKIKVKGNDKSK